jgi:hypothetical protein
VEKVHLKMGDQLNVRGKQVIGKNYSKNYNNISFIDLALSQVAGEYGSSREPDIITAKCQNLRVIIEKVHR